MPANQHFANDNGGKKLMKATGIVRRIDDLGRVVIPKEIRRTMRIREGDPLEIYTDHEGEVIFKKYSPIGELTGFATQYADTLHKTCELLVVITDRDSVIACAGVPKKSFIDKRLSDDIERVIENRVLFNYKPGEKKFSIIEDAPEGFYTACAMPIIPEGDITGCVAMLLQDTNDRAPSELEIKLIQTAGRVLKQAD